MSVVSLYAGDDCRVPGLLQGRIAYAGMPSPEAFSLVNRRDIGPNYACNLFRAVDARDITVAGVKVHIESVSPDKITIQVEHTRKTRIDPRQCPTVR
jgi:hypothetical protein